jgi:cell division ATPase FtsA
MCEIADWVRREIKNANCGKKFQPVVLLTGGGAEMQHIEELFLRELNVIDVRTAYPEYGFTATMSEHISTMAYSTVASLLLYGSIHGSCNIAKRVPQAEEPVLEREAFERPAYERPQQSQQTQSAPQQTQSAPQQSEEKSRATVGTLPRIEAEDVADSPVGDIDDTLEYGLEGDKKSTLWNKLRVKATKVVKSFTASEDDFEL